MSIFAWCLLLSGKFVFFGGSLSIHITLSHLNTSSNLIFRKIVIYLLQFSLRPIRAYSIDGHISYILEANSKRPIMEKKELENEVKLCWRNWMCWFFSFLTKTFDNIWFSFTCFQDNNNKRYCLYSMRKVSKEELFMHRESFVDIIFYIFW